MAPALRSANLSEELPHFFRLLADETRLMIARLLALSDLCSRTQPRQVYLLAICENPHVSQNVCSGGEICRSGWSPFV